MHEERTLSPVERWYHAHIMYWTLRKHVHGRILIQLAIIAIAAILLLLAVVNDAIAGHLGAGAIIVAGLIGFGIGVLSAQMFALSWHDETEKIIMRMDRTSLLLVGLYVVFRVGSAKLLGNYFTGAALSAISFAVLDGILIGRFVSMWHRIRTLLNDKGK